VIIQHHDVTPQRTSSDSLRTLRYCPQHGDVNDVFRICPHCRGTLVDRRAEFELNRPRPCKGLDPASH
jgi:hypothetical protein